MEPNIAKFIEIVKASGLEQADKDALIKDLSNPAASMDQKQEMLSKFFKDKLAAIDAETMALIKPILDESKKQLDEAEAAYNKKIELLDSKIVQAEQVIGDAFDQVTDQ